MKKILEIKFGSHLYGTNTENSDLDLKAVYLPAAEEILLGNHKKTITDVRPKREGERNKKEDVDIEILSLDRFIDLLLQGQTMALDMLFANPSDYTFISEEGEEIMEYIYRNRKEFLNRNVNAFVGYAKQQAAKYGQKGFRIHAIKSSIDFLKSAIDPRTKIMQELNYEIIEMWIKLNNNEYVSIPELLGPNSTKVRHLLVSGKYYPFTEKISDIIKKLEHRYNEYGARAILAEKNEGIDWKALSHAVRVNSEAYELLTTTRITFPRPDKELLLNIKLGKIPYTDVANIIEDGLDKLQEATNISILPVEPNKKFAEQFIIKIYGDIVKGKL